MKWAKYAAPAAVAAAIAVAGTGVVAAEPPPVTGAAAAEFAGMIGALRDRGARLTALGEQGGLAGWLVELGRGDSYTLYVAPDGHAVAGLMYGPDGTLLTRGQVETARGAPPPARGTAPAAAGRSGATRIAQADGSGAVPRGAGGRYPGVPERAVREIVAGKPAPPGLFARSASLFGFTLGHRGRQAVIFADPECPWSARAVDELDRLALRGGFRLRVVPVGLLGAASARSAIRIAASADPALAWYGRDVAPAHRAGSQWVEENNGVYEEWGEDAVPLIAWPSPAGGYLYRVGSIPGGRADVWVAEIFGQ